jgi:hypothetical protein
VKNLKQLLAPILTALIIACCLLCLPPAEAQTTETIYIKEDGTIIPATASIQQANNCYRLTENIYNTQIVLQRNNIILDAAGFALQGTGFGVAVNITCNNATVQNLHATNWETAVLGVYSDGTIQNCTVTRNEKGIVIYAENYRVVGNYVAENNYGVHLKGSQTRVSQNQLVDNGVGIWLESYGGYKDNTITYNTIQTNGKIAIETDTGKDFTVHHNNFILNDKQPLIVQTSYPPGDDNIELPAWDNGQEGNYWSNYAPRYPDAKEIEDTGIGNVPYVINVKPRITDRYPLVNKINIPEAGAPAPSLTVDSTLTTLPTPTQTPQPENTAQSTPTPKYTPSSSPTTSTKPTPTTQPEETSLAELLANPILIAAIVATAVATAVYIHKEGKQNSVHRRGRMVNGDCKQTPLKIRMELHRRISAVDADLKSAEINLESLRNTVESAGEDMETFQTEVQNCIREMNKIIEAMSNISKSCNDVTDKIIQNTK